MEKISIFISYCHADKSFKDDLIKYLKSITNFDEGIDVWHDSNIRTGENITDKINENLSKTSIIVCLISPDYLASDYCINKELKYALESGMLEKANIFPVIARKCNWSHSIFSSVKCQPEDGKPIISWEDKDDVYTKVIDELVLVVKNIRKGSDELKKK